MARMIPSVISEEDAQKSPAEARIFEWLRNMTWGNATVLHSLPLKDHIRNSFGEIDFVVLCEKGILCIEVKGGGVERRDGRWGFTGRHGTTWKNQGPYAQVQGNMKSLKTYLDNHIKLGDEIRDCRVACCVMTPDCVIKADDDTEIIPEITFNANMREKDLPAVFERCFNYWEKTKRYAGAGNLSSKARERLTTFLRGDFSFIPSLSVILNRSEEQLLSTTQEQLDIIVHMGVNDRMMVEGGAGTGKTLLAAEQCRRSVIAGEKVLYLCFNRSIASYVREVFASNQEEVDVFTFHELLMKACGTPHVPDDTEDLDSYFQETLPNQFITMMDQVSITRYDRVIIDEGQDLMNMTAYLCIGEFIKDGWESGKWTIYYDPNQNIFGTDEEFNEVWNALRRSSFVYPLTTNCRNTKQIAQGNYAVTHVYKPKYMRAEGEDIVYKTYSSKDAEADMVFNEIRRLRSEGISKKDIVILSYYRMDNENCCLCGRAVPPDIGNIRVNVAENFSECKNIRFYTIQSFKGLEAKAVIMIDVDSLSDDHKRLMNYVGMSRARTYLEFFYDEKLYNERQQRLMESLIQ